MTSATTAPRSLPGLGRVVPPFPGSRRSLRIIERNLMVFRRIWLVIFSGFFEPLFYLFSISVGIEQLVGDVDAGGSVVTYGEFVAPALLASAAMNGAVTDSTFNVFFKLRNKTYDAVVSTPVGVGDVATGEILWALMRGGIYAAAFLVVMAALGLASSPLALLAVPAALLLGFAFAACGVAATTFMRTWQDFNVVGLVTLPLFLFSATFYPLSTYPEPLRSVVQVSPLYHGADLIRSLTFGDLRWALLAHVAFLAIMGLAGLAVASRRMERHLLH